MADPFLDNVTVVSVLSGTVLATIPVGGGTLDAVYDNDTAEVYVSETTLDQVAVISAGTDQLVRDDPRGRTARRAGL